MVAFELFNFAAAFDCAVVAETKHDSSTAFVQIEENIVNISSGCSLAKDSQEKKRNESKQLTAR